jgi:dihydrofolate reductase
MIYIISRQLASGALQRIHGGVVVKVRVLSFGVSMDGYGAGPNQGLEHPLGVGGLEIMGWFHPTRVFQRMYGDGGGETGVDNDMAQLGFAGVGAWILGRNMFGPIRGPWPDESWKGWWGDEPPYHVPVFVLTHHATPRWSRQRPRRAVATSA